MAGNRLQPPITARRPRHVGPWIWVLVFAALAIPVWLLEGRQTHVQLKSPQSQPSAGRMAVPVLADPARLANVPVYLDGLGSVTAFYTVTVRTRVDGQLMSVNFQEGQDVHEGDLLAEVDPRPFQVQLEQAEGQMAHDQALLADALLDLDRYGTLITKDAIPKQQYDTQRATVAEYQAAIKTDQAAIDNAKLQLVYCRITAPISGRVGLRLVDPGNIVHANDASGLLVITQIQPITVVFTLPEESFLPVIPKLRSGGRLEVDAFNRDKTKKIAAGYLLTPDNTIDQSTGTLKLKAEFENKDGILFPNEFVNVRLLVEVRSRQVIVPAVAIQHGPQGTFVFVVKSDNTVETRPVTAGITEGDVCSIDRGLKAGERVVTEGAENLQPGSRVTVKAGAAAPQGSSSRYAPVSRGGPAG